MQFSLAWLRELCPTDAAVERIAMELTSRGLTADSVEYELPARVSEAADPSSQLRLEIVEPDLGGCEGEASVEVIVEDPSTSAELVRRAVTVMHA